MTRGRITRTIQIGNDRFCPMAGPPSLSVKFSHTRPVPGMIGSCSERALARRWPTRRSAMKRRDFIAFLGGATAWVATAHAQERGRTIGVLGSGSHGAFPGTEAAFIEGLRAAGFIEGRNISIDWRWAEGQYDRLSSLAGELLSRNVAVIVTFDAPASFAAKAATKATPIVFLTGTDPVEIGLVQSFSRLRFGVKALGPVARAAAHSQQNRVTFKPGQSERPRL